jgi:serpin B
MNTLNDARGTTVTAALPKFTYEFDIEMNKFLSAMGMPSAFDSAHADFSNLGVSPGGNIYINRVLHKTFIEVDERGTKAAAVTKVEIDTTSAPPPPPEVILDRPFVYAIIDNATNLPVFIGALLEIP